MARIGIDCRLVADLDDAAEIHHRHAGRDLADHAEPVGDEEIGETEPLLQVLAQLDPHPESVPINALVAVPGTPLEDEPPVDPLEFVRMVATARIVLPFSRVRLSAGRQQLNREAQLLCLLAGADSIFYGDVLLTTGNPDVEADRALLACAGVNVAERTEVALPPC